MEEKLERADAVGEALSGLNRDPFQKYIVGSLSQYLRFPGLCTRR
ncbi:MAG: hypothetical protein ABI988_19900 [Nitrospirota bacterium]